MSKLDTLKQINNLLDGPYTNNPYFVPPYKKRHYKKTYENKNSNVEYYTDEKGNIRRRKINKLESL